MKAIQDPVLRRVEPFGQDELVLVQSVCGTRYAYAMNHPERGWEIYRACYSVDMEAILSAGERYAPTTGRTVPGYRLMADVRTAHPGSAP